MVSDYTALLSGQYWNSYEGTARPAFVTFSFEQSAPSYLADSGYSAAAIASFKPFDAQVTAWARDALAQWDAASGIKFIEVPSGQGDIRFSGIDTSLTPIGPASGYAAYPNQSVFNPDTAGLEGGDVFFDISTIGPGFDLGYLSLHEIGHAIGFKHTFAGSITLDPSMDNRSNSVMSYSGAFQFSQQLQLLDIQAAQAIYGATDGSNLVSWNWDPASLTLEQIDGNDSDVLAGTSIRDVIFGAGGNDKIAGFSGNDALEGGAGDDSLHGGAGGDTLYGGSGADTLDGGVGVDAVDYSVASTAVVVHLDTTAQYGQYGSGVGGAIETDALISIENVTTGSGADYVYGSTGTNLINTGANNDIVYGGAGADTLSGGSGTDMLDGGADSDTVDYSAASTVVVVHLDTPTQYGQYGSGSGGAVETDTLVSIENVTTGSGADYVYGSASANAINTGANNDYVLAGNGTDTVNSGSGLDYVEGSYGSDTINAGSENDKVYGGADNDTIYGSDGDDSIYGDHGNDTLYGGEGKDVLFVDSADVTYDGGVGIDYLVWQDVSVAANVSLAAHSLDYAYGYTGSDTFYATGAMTRVELHGGGGNDVLVGGGSGGSILLGEGDNDRLVSEIGIDHMVGGAGADTFVFSSGGGVDYVYDFRTGGADKVTFTALAGAGIHSLADLVINVAYAASGWFGYNYGSGTAWLNTSAIGSIQPVASDFLFA